jgi:hypothetical protein
MEMSMSFGAPANGKSRPGRYLAAMADWSVRDASVFIR